MSNDKMAATFANCKGECCRNPYRVCLNKRRCQHHKDEQRTQAAAESWQEVQEQALRRAERLSKAESKRISEWSHWR